MKTVSRKTDAPKRIVRPMKLPTKGKRAALSLLVRPEIKRLVDARAKANSRTQSQEAEMMIERCLQYEKAMADLGIELGGIETGPMPTVEAAFWRRGYTPVRHLDGEGRAWKLWAEPGFPGVERSGFVP